MLGLYAALIKLGARAVLVGIALLVVAWFAVEAGVGQEMLRSLIGF